MVHDYKKQKNLVELCRSGGRTCSRAGVAGRRAAGWLGVRSGGSAAGGVAAACWQAVAELVSIRLLKCLEKTLTWV